MERFDYESKIISIPDYPESGIIFKDITPLYADAEALASLTDDIAAQFADKGITKVVGCEALGFPVAAPVAYKLGVGFVPARKPGKLPRAAYTQSYSLEYGTDELQIHKDALGPDDVVLIADDLVATAGTAVATAKLIERTGAKVAGFAFIIELAFLNPRDIISKDYGDVDIFSLVKVN